MPKYLFKRDSLGDLGLSTTITTETELPLLESFSVKLS